MFEWGRDGMGSLRRNLSLPSALQEHCVVGEGKARQRVELDGFEIA